MYGWNLRYNLHFFLISTISSKKIFSWKISHDFSTSILGYFCKSLADTQRINNTITRHPNATLKIKLQKVNKIYKHHLDILKRKKILITNIYDFKDKVQLAKKKEREKCLIYFIIWIVTMRRGRRGGGDFIVI